MQSGPPSSCAAYLGLHPAHPPELRGDDKVVVDKSAGNEKDKANDLHVRKRLPADCGVGRGGGGLEET